MEDNTIFRPTKRRKFVRQYGPKAEDEADEVEPLTAHPGSDHDTNPEDSSVSSILRLRRQQRSRAGGVTFSNSRSTSKEDVAGSTVLVPAENPTDNLQGIADRFVGHSGQVVDVDKHMVAYIDSEMAKRRIAHASTEQTQSGTLEDHASFSGSGSVSIQPSTRQPTSWGLLTEVEVKDKAPQSLEPLLPKPRKARLDRFGRPLPSRKPRRGPTSEDIARDKLVEDILNESGLDVYQKQDKAQERSADEDGDADSRLASQFQQDYLDAMQSRQEAQKKAMPGADPGQKGPKLGGSRQQRAAMRERELKDEKGKAGSGG